MVDFSKFKYVDFILLNEELSFHPGGLISTFNLISNTSGLDKEKSILDIGCGNGISLKMLHKLGYKNLYGYDSSQNFSNSTKDLKDGINYVYDLDKIQSTHIYLILIESLLNFISPIEEATVIETINKIIYKYKIKYLAIVDFYSIVQLSNEFKSKLNSVFNIKNIKSTTTIYSFLNNAIPNSKIIYYKDHLLTINLTERFKSLDLVDKLFENKFLPNPFRNKDEANIYFSNFINEILTLYKSFTEQFKYFECILSLS